MKKKNIVSLVLAIVMVCSLWISAAADYSTKVSYTGTGTENYTVTVPGTLNVSSEETVSGTVSVEGAWASNRQLTVRCPTTVTLTNSINALDTKVLDVTFAGISMVGNNCSAITADDAGASAELTVARISDALFGKWEGSITYTVAMNNASSES